MFKLKKYSDLTEFLTKLKVEGLFAYIDGETSSTLLGHPIDRECSSLIESQENLYYQFIFNFKPYLNNNVFNFSIGKRSNHFSNNGYDDFNKR